MSSGPTRRCSCTVYAPPAQLGVIEASDPSFGTGNPLAIGHSVSVIASLQTHAHTLQVSPVLLIILNSLGSHNDQLAACTTAENAITATKMLLQSCLVTTYLATYLWV